jgi:CRAL/TRIO domain
MRPSRCAAKKVTESKDVLHSLVYSLGTMMERESPCTHGVAFLANMDDFAMSNFATDYWFQFMSILQGVQMPVRVNLLLIVNPPEWFVSTIWNIMKTMLTLDFQERVKMISEFELPQYLVAGYEEYLPDDLTSGKALTDALVADFVDYRKAIEAAQGHNNNNDSSSLVRQNSLRRGSSSSTSRDLLGGSLNQTSLRLAISRDDSDCSLRAQMTKNNKSLSSRSSMALEKPPREQNSSINNNNSSSRRMRTACLEDSESSSFRGVQMLSSSCRSMMASNEKPPISKQRSGMMAKQTSIRAFAADSMMNMSMPIMSRKMAHLSSAQKSPIKRQSSEKTASMSSQSSKSNIILGHDNGENDEESLSVFDLATTGSDLLVETSISGGTVATASTASSSTSRLPSTACW